MECHCKCHVACNKTCQYDTHYEEIIAIIDVKDKEILELKRRFKELLEEYIKYRHIKKEIEECLSTLKE